MPPTFCPQCRAETRDGARFCYACGTALSPDVPGATIVPAPVAAVGGAMVMSPAPAFAPHGAAPAPLPYPSQGGPFAPPYPPPHYAAPRRSGMAVAGFCVGLAAIFPGIILTWVGTIIGLCGLIFSLIGLRETGRAAALRSGPRTGRTLAIAGAILSLVGIALSIALLIYIFNHLSDFGIVWPPERTR